MKRRRLSDLIIEWDCGDLPFDPIEPALPFELPHDAERDAGRPADVRIWCARCTDALPPAVPVGAVPSLEHGLTRCFVREDRLVIDDGASRIHVLDEGRRLEVFVHPSSIEQPFRFMLVTVMMGLLLALRYHGYFHFHAAAARWPSGETWLIPGDSGAGKSTLALALFAAGAHWISDDALLLRRSRESVEAIGWARRMRMSELTGAAFPELAKFVFPCWPESTRRLQFDPREAFPGRRVASAHAPFTLLFPTIAEVAREELRALGPADAFGHALHAGAWVAGNHLVGREEQLQLLARMVEQSRAFELRLGSRVLREPERVARDLRALIPSV